MLGQIGCVCIISKTLERKKAMMILNYSSKKELKENIGEPLNYTETSIFGPEYRPNGTFCGSNRPQITGNKGREFFAEVTMREGLIEKVT
jgi:hypothetical protein